ncbi:MAG: hypothetical protein KDD03_01560, partial [Gelidibacter sp.]|nr:hypothetical protein [Gelidibacter sp.]
ISGAGDTIPPTVSSFVIADGAATTGVITFNESVTFPNVTGLSMDGDFADITLSAPTGLGTTWNVTLSRAAVNGEVGNFVYGATNTIADTSSNALVAGSTAVTNNVTISLPYALKEDFEDALNTTTDWDFVNTHPTDVVFVKNTSDLTITANTVVHLYNENFYKSKITLPVSGTVIASWDITSVNARYANISIGLTNASGSNIFYIQPNTTTSTSMYFRALPNGGSNQAVTQSAIMTNTTLRMILTNSGSDIAIEVWNGTGWTNVMIQTGITGITGDLSVFFTAVGRSTNTESITFDNVYLTDTIYTGRYPDA